MRPHFASRRRLARPRWLQRTDRQHPMRPGAALISTLICLLVLMMRGEALMALSAAGLHLAERTRRSTLAFNLAESGAARAGRWLKDEASPPAGTTAIDPFGG